MPVALLTRPLLDRVPAWVLRANGKPADVDFDFTNNRYWYQGLPNTLSILGSSLSLITVSRASVGYIDNKSGIWTQVDTGRPRVSDKGLLVEEARTNVVLWNRDLTNAAWTKSNITAALDQVGVDGTVNSASSIVATAGNGTVLQAITLASSARWQTAFVKRISGSGIINMTMDNGATWTAITVTSGWTRVALPTQTLANPTVGFRIVTSGDAIAVDFVQNEASGLFATSPILTTTASATRALDSVLCNTSLSAKTAVTFYMAGTVHSPKAAATSTILHIRHSSDNNNRLFVNRNITTGFLNALNVSGGTVVWNTTNNVALEAEAPYGIAITSRSGRQSAAFNGTFLTGGTGAFPLLGLDNFNIGNNPSANQSIRRCAYWIDTELPNSDLSRLSLL